MLILLIIHYLSQVSDTLRVRLYPKIQKVQPRIFLWQEGVKKNLPARIMSSVGLNELFSGALRSYSCEATSLVHEK